MVARRVKKTTTLGCTISLTPPHDSRYSFLVIYVFVCLKGLPGSPGAKGGPGFKVIFLKMHGIS